MACRISVIMIAVISIGSIAAIAQPTFTGGSPQVLTVCENSGANSINGLLTVADPASGSTETWSTASAPAHGTLAASYTTTSTGGTLIPTGLTYSPTSGYSGTDAFTVHVSNGTVTVSTVINVTVTATPAAIGGGLNVCSGATINLTDATSGGTWSSASPSVATIGTTGIVTGISGGTSIISYTKSGCSVTATVTDNSAPGAISGASTVCIGSATSLSDVPPNGTWSSSNVARATVVATSGLVTGVSAGAVTITYSTGCGTAATLAMTVLATPAAITGTTTECIGANTTLADVTAGGIWTSSNTSIATNAAGVFTGISAGTVIATYSTGCGTAATATVTVKGVPVAISGSSPLCVGSSTTLSDATANGAWTSSNAGIASISATTGLVTGIAAGNVTLTYSTGCGTAATFPLTVLAAPAAITGATSECIGANTTLADATAGGTWSTSDPAIATNSAGVITGIGAGTVTVTYSTGCGIAAKALVTVKGSPASITGATTVCVGSTITLLDSTAGGTWTSTNTGRATVIGSTGVVTGVAAGTLNINYSIGCGTTATYAITVVASPAAITGTTSLCAGADVILADATAGGTWSTSNSAIAVNSVNEIVGVATGTVTVTYNTGCGTPATTMVTVKGTPASITGATTVCVGATITLSDSTTGGTWSSSSTGRASVVSSTGVVTGVSAGAVNITYTNGCGTSTYAITVIASPAAITGTTILCAGTDVILADATAGGTWSTGDSAIATNSTNEINGVAAGTVTVTYNTGCGTPATTVVTVKGIPSTIAGPATVCVGSTITLSDSTTGGTWSSSSSGRASVVSTTGVVTGVSAGAVIITYSNSCGAAATSAITVVASPAAITGTIIVCSGAGVILADATAGGTWSTSNSAIATNSGSNVIGVSAGTVTVTYNTGCGTPATTLFTVKAAPSVISGPSGVCIGSTITLTDSATGGTWTSSNTARATVGSATGIVYGVAAGALNITYSTGCGANATYAISTLTTPVAITGAASTYIGSTVSLADATAGGTWISGSTSVATISTSGVVIGESAGSTIITYTTGCGTAATATINVAAGPAPIAGAITICVGSTMTMTDVTPGGTWSSSNAGRATIVNSTGVVTGIAAGAVNISYTTTGGTATYAITIIAAPASVTGTTSVCTEANTTLADATAGGTWSVSNTAIATNAAGVITGMSAGTVTVTYSTGCGTAATSIVTVKGLPSVITGANTVCIGSTITLSDSVAGGTWTSSNGGRATIVNSTGVVTGVAAGAVNMTYNNGCGTSTYAITVLASPAAITGTTSICSGADVVLADATAGGTWSTSNAAIATNSAGDITGVSAGTVVVTYSTGCGTGATTIFTVKAGPSLITGATTVCTGATISLSDSIAGGTWSSSSTGRATVVNTTGVVTGVSAGAVNMTYNNGCGTATYAITVIASPAAITGTTSTCAGAGVILADATAGGTWSTSNSAIATNSGANITGVSAGTVTVTYNNGCGSGATTVFTVKGGPSAITGATTVCVGSPLTLSDSIAGGTWASSNTGRASVISSTGVVTGVGAGAVNITYSTGCGTSATYAITVVSGPAAITGTTNVCPGADVILSDATAGGTWSVSDPTIATVSGGVVQGISSGTVTVTYNTGCTIGATTVVTVKASPASITGLSAVCVASTITLSDVSPLGTWSSSNAGRATVVAATGVVTGVSAGAVTISYSTGCGAAVTYPVTVKALPAAITGTAAACIGATSSLSDVTASGTWSSATLSVATVGTTGVVTGISSGTSSISYTVNGCVSAAVFTVQGSPASITGTTSICNGATTTLHDATSGGSWSSSNTSVATVNSSGAVTSVTIGTSIITYSTGCGTAATATVSVQSLPGLISGSSSFCTGSPVSFSDGVSGGTWSSSNTSIATVDPVLGAVSALSAGTATISYSLTNACGTNVVTYGINVAVTGTWLGAVSTNWTDAGNWACGNIPDATHDAIIPPGTPYDLIVTANVTANNFTVNYGAGITINSGNTLSVNQTLANSGVISGSGFVTMSGSSAQLLQGVGYVNNLQIDNSAGVSVSSGDSVKVKEDLQLTLGTLTTNNGIMLASDSTGTGRIDQITGGAISGNVTVQQYIAAGRRAYRFWAHPFSSSIALSQIENYIDITGALGSTNGFTTTLSNAASSYWYNTSIGNSSLGTDPGWTAFTSTNGLGSNAFNQFEGIRLFIRGAKGEGLTGATYTPSAVTINMAGPVNTGSISMPMVKGTGPNADYNLLGNPYPSPVDIGTVIYNAQTTGQVTGGAFYVWDPYMSISGQFVTVAISSSPYYIEGNASFELRTAANGDVLNFAESNKSATMSSVLLRTASTEHLALNIYDTSYHLWDMMNVNFNEAATDNEDAKYDGAKPSGPAALNFYSLSADNVKLSLDVRPYSAGKVIPLGIKSSYAQSFIIKADNVAIPQGGQVYLVDNYLNKSTLLTQGQEYRFTITSDSMSQGNKRFELRMGDDQTATAQNVGSLDVKMLPNPATEEVTVTYQAKQVGNVNLRLLNVAGTSVLEQNLGTNQSGNAKVNIEKLAAGIYMVEITCGNEQIVQRLVKE